MQKMSSLKSGNGHACKPKMRSGKMYRRRKEASTQPNQKQGLAASCVVLDEVAHGCFGIMDLSSVWPTKPQSLRHKYSLCKKSRNWSPMQCFWATRVLKVLAVLAKPSILDRYHVESVPRKRAVLCSPRSLEPGDASISLLHAST